MKLLLIAVIFSVLSGCGMSPRGSAGNNVGYQDQPLVTNTGE